MSEQTIKCPKCGAEIPLTEALKDSIRDSLRSEIEATANKKALEQFSAKERVLQEELEEKRKQLSEANKKELELLKKQQELEQAKENIELEVQRKITEERKRISEEASKKAVEEQQLKMREKDDQLTAMKKQIDELKRKAEVGSQERQGEVLEEELKELLERKFPRDDFEDVLKGNRGADIIQVVNSPSGKVCGKILWESKNTKEFSKAWIEKLKKDQAGAGAEFAILMTVAMPREVRDFDYHNDVWVTNYKCAIGLCTSLRQSLINAARERIIAEGQEGMKDFVYKYVTGPEFGRRIKRIVDAYVQMKADLETEQRSMLRIWKKREKQIAVIIENAAEMRGEIEGLVGGQKALPEIETLSLDSIAEDTIETSNADE